MQMHRVTNMGAEPVYAEYNGRTFIWDPHPSKAAGHYTLKSKPGNVPIPRNVPVAFRDTIYRDMDGVRGDYLEKVPGANVYIHHVPSELVAALKLEKWRNSTIPGRKTLGLVFDDEVLDAQSSALENLAQEAANQKAQIASAKDELAAIQAQIAGAQEQAKAHGILKQAEDEAGIRKPVNRVIK